MPPAAPALTGVAPISHAVAQACVANLVACDGHDWR